MATNADALVEEGIRAYRAGNKVEARRLLEKATDLDQMNEKAWLWLSAVVDSPEDQRICLENVLFINPNSKDAQRGLKLLDEKPAAAPSGAQKPPTAPLPQTPPPAPTPADPYYVPTSSVSGNFNPANDLKADELDNWVQGLNLGGNTPAMEEEDESDSDIIADAFGLSFGFDDDDDEDDLRSQFGGTEDDFEQFDGPFTANTLDFNDDDFDLPVPAAPAPEPKRPAAKASPTPATRQTSTSEVDNLFEDDFEDNIEVDVNYFAMIPKKIKATRLPGTDDPNPVVYVAGFVVLLLLNIAAAVLLVI
ncbi:MAG: hypothetical protein OHK0046_46830 [Anaerolineae bacterium]